MTMPRIFGPNEFDDDDVHVIEVYEGAKITIIAPAGNVVTYSYVDDPDATVQDADSSVATTEIVTVLDVVWPFFAFERTTGGDPYRVAVT